MEKTIPVKTSTFVFHKTYEWNFLSLAWFWLQA